MEAPRLADIAAAHPEVQISRVTRRVLGAWIPDEPGSTAGTLLCADGEEALAAKLAAKYGG